MGWSSGVELFDSVVDDILELDISDKTKKKLIKKFIHYFEGHDMDGVSESKHADNKLFISALKNLYPEWYK